MAITIKVSIRDKPIEKILLKATKTLDGNIIIADHPDMDIIVLPAKSKIVTMPKEDLDDELYGTQERFFRFLFRRGVANHDSFKSGNLFMSMEATIPEVAGKGDKLQYVLYVISSFIEEEKPAYESQKEFEEQFEKSLLDPEPDEFTEFDPRRQLATKGSLPPKMVSYGIHSIYRV
jgi:hypothetical protein